MSLSIIFAVAYFLGTCVGVASGLLLPWWLSGAAAWVLAGALMVWPLLRPSQRALQRIFEHDPPQVVGDRLRALMDRCAAMNLRVVLGLFWGAMAGAGATSMPAVLDWLLWPGHGDVALCVMLAGVVAASWLLVSLADVGEDDCRPGLVGLALYLAVVTLCALPALWEVL